MSGFVRMRIMNWRGTSTASCINLSRRIWRSFRFRCEVGNGRLRSLNDFSHHNANVGCVCSCGHQGVVHRDLLTRWAFLKRKNVAMENLPGYLRCTDCGARPIHIAPTPLGPTIPK